MITPLFPPSFRLSCFHLSKCNRHANKEGRTVAPTLLKYNVFEDIDSRGGVESQKCQLLPDTESPLRRAPLSGQELRKICYRPVLQISKPRGRLKTATASRTVSLGIAPA